MSRTVERTVKVDVHEDSPWVGSLIGLMGECPMDRPVHFRGWMASHHIYSGMMFTWEVRWYTKEAHAA